MCQRRRVANSNNSSVSAVIIRCMACATSLSASRYIFFFATRESCEKYVSVLQNPPNGFSVSVFRNMLLEEHQIKLPADMNTQEFRATVTTYPVGNCALISVPAAYYRHFLLTTASALGFVWLNLAKSPAIADRLISVSKASHDSSTGKMKHWLTFDKFKQSATIAQNDPTQTGNRVGSVYFNSSPQWAFPFQQNWQQGSGPSPRGGAPRGLRQQQEGGRSGNRGGQYPQQRQQNYTRESCWLLVE